MKVKRRSVDPLRGRIAEQLRMGASGCVTHPLSRVGVSSGETARAHFLLNLSALFLGGATQIVIGL